MYGKTKEDTWWQIGAVGAVLLSVSLSFYAGVAVADSHFGNASEALKESYDVVVVGGTSYGVAAAMAAREAGAKVFVAAPRGYLGEDIAGKYVLAPEDGDDASHPLYAKLWAGPGRAQRPLAVKKLLDKTLLDAKLPFRTWMPTVDVARDSVGRVAGIVTWTRGGLRTIRAKCVIDATERAWVSRRAGAEFAPFPAGDYVFTRHVVSGEEPRAEGMTVRRLAATGNHGVQKINGNAYPGVVTGILWACEMKLPMKDGSALSFAEAEQLARDKTWTRLQLEGADTLVMSAPPDGLVKPAEGVFTAGPLAGPDYSSPGTALAAAAALGRRAAEYAKSAVAGEPAPAVMPAAPVVASCDVLVAGLGTGGAPAAIAAARRGAKTMGFEWAYRCGGLTTEGMIGSYYHGNRVGFTKEIDAGCAKEGVVHSAAKAQWFRAEARKAGAGIVFGAFVAGAVVENGRIAGAVVVFADGSTGVVGCRAAVDATGNADLAAAAGEETDFINADELSLQGAGFTRKALGASNSNVDYSFVDDTDAEDLWYVSLRGRFCYQDFYWDQSQVVASRERRRVRGVFSVGPQDVMLARTYPDIVCVTRSSFDTHGQTVAPQFFIEPPPHVPVFVNLPYRAMQPARTDNLLVVGLGLSAHRDAMPILRMVPDVQNQGFVAGTACAMALESGATTRTLDVKALQRILVAKGVVPESVLTAKDSLPLSDEAVAEAVKSLPDGYRGLAAVFAEPGRSLPLLRAAYDGCGGGRADERLVYAHVLALLGDGRGAADLAAKVRETPWDDGWNWRGMGQFGRSVSWLDSYIIALGRTRSPDGFDAVALRARELGPDDAYSHFRAVAMAFESMGDRRAAPMLKELLQKPGVGGHSFLFERDGAPAIKAYDVYTFSGPDGRSRGSNSAPDRERSACLRELALARALYRLGDADGMGEKTLRAYVEDPRRAYANHARMVLSSCAQGKACGERGSAAAGCDVAAYVWPAYQPDPRWAELGIFGDGKGEWQNLYEAKKRQPCDGLDARPLWGYEDESNPVVVARKIDAATAAGVNVFIYDWYWYGGRPFLEDALDRGFLGAKNCARMKFFIMWANHDVNGLWNNRMSTADGKDKVIWPAKVSDDDFAKIVDRWISMYFSRPNYYRIEGRPVLSIYDIKGFVDWEGLGKAKARLAFLRERVKSAGFPGMHLQVVGGYFMALLKDELPELGVDSFTSYNWNDGTWPRMNDRSKSELTYSEWSEMAFGFWDAYRSRANALGAAYFPNLTIGWDTNARYPANETRRIVRGSNPADFERAARRAKAWAEANVSAPLPRLVTVNSWNEWTEGSYLEPDDRSGYGYLDALRNVFVR